jgi:hypothetical protein
MGDEWVMVINYEFVMYNNLFKRNFFAIISHKQSPISLAIRNAMLCYATIYTNTKINNQPTHTHPFL